jgi:hypothetical protein
MAEHWANTTVVRMPALQCPICHRLDPIRVRTGGTSTTIERLFICKHCSKRFRWIVDETLPLGETRLENV